VAGSEVSVVLEPPANPGLYGYAGWVLSLSATPVWSLDLGGAIDADLTGVNLSGLTLSGSGTARLGAVSGDTPLEVNGSFHLVVPPDVPARVVGVASVPATWLLTDNGATSPVSGEGWMVTVIGDGSVTISEG
jgi:hypothetical protein